MTANNDAAARRQHTVARKTVRCMLPNRTKISRFYFATYLVRFFLFKQGTLEYESMNGGHSYCLAMASDDDAAAAVAASDESESGLVDWLASVDPARLSVARTCTDRCQHRHGQMARPWRHASQSSSIVYELVSPLPLSLVSTSSTPQVGIPTTNHERHRRGPLRFVVGFRRGTPGSRQGGRHDQEDAPRCFSRRLG